MQALARPLPIGVFLLIGAATAAVHAQTARSGSPGNAQMLQQIQQLASERTAMQAENARLKRELEEVRKERDALKSSQAALRDRAAASETALSRTARTHEATEEELARHKERTAELIAKFRETAETLRSVETDLTASRQSLTLREQELKGCIDRNVALYKLNEEILARLDSQGVWSRFAQVEPFTRLKRVELENLVEDYRYRAEDQRVSPEADSPSAVKAR